MAYTKTRGTCCFPATSQKPKTIVGHDRLNWRHADGRLFLYYGNNRNPLLTVERDSDYTGMYRIRFPDGGLSDMANLTRAKDAAVALALKSLNSGDSGAQETPGQAADVRKKRAKVGKARRAANPLCEAPNGFLAEDQSSSVAIASTASPPPVASKCCRASPVLSPVRPHGTRSGAKASLMETCFTKRDFDTADERLAMCDSYQRTGQLFYEMAWELGSPHKQVALFLEWGNCCDAPFRWRSYLAEVLRDALKHIRLVDVLDAPERTWFEP